MRRLPQTQRFFGGSLALALDCRVASLLAMTVEALSALLMPLRPA